MSLDALPLNLLPPSLKRHNALNQCGDGHLLYLFVCHVDLRLHDHVIVVGNVGVKQVRIDVQNSDRIAIT
jgi:hypothetical protein